MLSLIVGGALCLCSAYLGFFIGGKYKKALKFCVEWSDFNGFCKQNITYLKKPIDQIVTEFSYQKKGDFIDLLQQYSTDKVNFKQGDYFQKFNLIKGQNKLLLIEYFNDIGSLNYSAQIERIDYYKSILDKIVEDAKIKSKNNGALACKLGIILGIALMIILA